MAERTCCPDTDLLVFGHVSCEQAQPVRPAWVIQPSSAPPAGHARTPIESLQAIGPACVSGTGDVSVYVLPEPGDFSDDQARNALMREQAIAAVRPRRRRLLGRNTR